MVIIKCKMCGGDMELSADKTFGTCEYCGSTMTLPKVEDDQRAAQFNRGNHFRRSGEFDKALAIYERIVAENDDDAEAHWCCALSRFGIEYVEDPTTMEYLPTCHRASFDSFLDDVDYLAALEHSDGITKRQYQKDAAKIADVQKGILFTRNTETRDIGNRSNEAAAAVVPTDSDIIDLGALLKRGNMALEDGEWGQAKDYFDQVLNADAENAEAYLGLLLVEQCAREQEKLKDCEKPFDNSQNNQNTLRFSDQELQAEEEHLERERQAEAERKDAIYRIAKSKLKLRRISDFEDAIRVFETIRGWRDTEAQIARYQQEIEKIKAEEETYRREAEARRREAEKREIDEIDEKEAEKITRRIKAILLLPVALYVFAKLAPVVVSVVVSVVRYNVALDLMDAGKYEEAIAAFETLDGYMNSNTQIRICEKEIEYVAGTALMDEGKYEEAIVKFEAMYGYKDSDNQIAVCQNALKDINYYAALALMNEGKYIEAVVAFRALSGYKDSESQLLTLLEINYNTAVTLMNEGKNAEAVFAFGAARGYKDANKQFQNLINSAHCTLSAGDYHTVGLKVDGTVVGVGVNLHGKCDVSDWKDIVAVSAGNEHTVGLNSNGTVVAVGDNDYGQCDVKNWQDIVAVSTGYSHTVGLKSDGSVVAVGDNNYGQCNVSRWKDIVTVSAGYRRTVGLKSDETVVAVGYNKYGQCDVSDWQDIVAVSAGSDHTVGLKTDGTVVAVGRNGWGQCDVSDWRDIVAVSAGDYHTVGLKADGTVVAVGYNHYGQCNVKSWQDIVAISVGEEHTVGLKADGTVVAVGYTSNGQCDVSDWQDIRMPY